MTELNVKNAINLGFNDLVILCEDKGLKVSEDDGREELLKKLKAKPDSKE